METKAKAPELQRVRAAAKFIRMSPRKVRLVANVVRGLDVNNALVKLGFLPKLAVKPIEKLLKSAITSAKHNYDIGQDNLIIKDITVDEGPKLKRWMPRAQGRATMILKRVSHIRLILEEKVPGKGPKKKTQRIKEKAEDHNFVKDDKHVEQTDEKKKDDLKPAAFVRPAKQRELQKDVGKAEDKKFLKKVFRRKSGE